MGYTCCVIEVRKTSNFAIWLDNLRDTQARARIQVRIRRLSQGLAGDVKPVGEGVSEMAIDNGPGYLTFASEENFWYFSLPAAIKEPNPRTLQRPSKCPAPCEVHDGHEKDSHYPI